MSDFKAKMHQIRFPPQTPLEELTGYSPPPDLLAVFKGPISKRREGEEGWGREG